MPTGDRCLDLPNKLLKGDYVAANVPTAFKTMDESGDKHLDKKPTPRGGLDETKIDSQDDADVSDEEAGRVERQQSLNVGAEVADPPPSNEDISSDTRNGSRLSRTTPPEKSTEPSFEHGFTDRAAIRKESRQSRETKVAHRADRPIPGAFDMQGDSPVSNSESCQGLIAQHHDDNYTPTGQLGDSTDHAAITDIEIEGNGPIVAQLVEERDTDIHPRLAENVREEIREDVRRELQQEMIASAVAANAVQVEIVTQDEEDPQLTSNPNHPEYVAGSPMRYPPVDTGLVCVGLYMLLTMAVASVYMTEFFGGVCYCLATCLFSLATPTAESTLQQSSFVRILLESLIKAYLFMIVGPCVVMDFAVSMLAVPWLELHAFAGYLFVGTLNGCESGRICSTFLRKVFVWKRWKIRLYHKNWKLKRNYLVLETWQENELKGDYETLRANFDRQQLERAQRDR